MCGPLYHAFSKATAVYWYGQISVLEKDVQHYFNCQYLAHCVISTCVAFIRSVPPNTTVKLTVE